MDIIEFIILVALIAIATFGLSLVILDIDNRINDIEDKIRRLNDDK